MFKRNESRSGGKSFGKRDSGPVVMHRATCASCGNSCEVPFKPNGKKPVLCGDCFRKDDGGGERNERPSYRTSERSFDRPERSQSKYTRFDDNKPSYPATCGDCGARCTVPFKPMQGKPVKCRECFVPGDRPSSNGEGSSAEFAILNTKLDAILKALGAYASTPRKVADKKVSKKVEKEDEDDEDEDEDENEVTSESEAKPAKKAWAKLSYKK